MTRLLLRVDAGPTTGLGHLSRCVAFAEEAAARGWEAAVAGRLERAGWLAARLAELGVPVLAGDWLDHARSADVVLVDHYGLGEVHAEVAAAGARLVSMEDGPFGRRRADIVVDCGLAPIDRPPDGSGLVLHGPRFAPLRAAVREARRSSTARSGDPRVVVVMGGGAAGTAVEAVVTALLATGMPLEVVAVSAEPVAAPDPGAGQRVEVTGPRTDLPRLCASADLVVSAAGVTLLELCCLAAPTAALAIADNQEAGYREAVRQGLVRGLGSLADFEVDRAAEVLTELLGDPLLRAQLGAAAGRAVDGLGARRVLDEVTR